MTDQIGETDLSAKVEYGSIIKEHDPETAEGSGVFRYRHNTVLGENKVTIKRSQQKTEEAECGEAACCRNLLLLMNHQEMFQTLAFPFTTSQADASAFEKMVAELEDGLPSGPSSSAGAKPKEKKEKTEKSKRAGVRLAPFYCCPLACDLAGRG